MKADAVPFLPRGVRVKRCEIRKGWFLLAPERRDRVLAPLRSETGFDGQFARIPAFLFVSHTVALGGAAARLMAQVEQG